MNEKLITAERVWCKRCDTYHVCDVNHGPDGHGGSSICCPIERSEIPVTRNTRAAARLEVSRKRRVLHDHDDLTDEDDDYHEWVATYDRQTRQPFERMRDRLGREGNGGYSAWLVWQCNNPNCKAEAIVSVEAIEQEVIQWLKH